MPRRRPTRARPRRRLWLVVAAAALVLLGGGGALAWSLTRGDATTTATERTVTVSRETVQETVGASGTVEPARRADLAFGAGGTVTSVRVAVGDTVARGDVLATLDDDDLRADLDAAEADLASAQDDLTTAEDDSSTTAAELAAAKAKVAVEEDAVSSGKTALEGAKLRATFAGTVAEVDVAKGDTVGSSGSGGTGAGSGATGGQAGSSGSSSGSSGTAVTVISTNRYTVSASVGSADLAKVKKGLQAQITTTGSTSTVFGTVASVAVMASSGSGTTGTGTGGSTTTGGAATFPVTIDVTGARNDLYAGATATVSIIVSQRDDVLTVPTAAVSTANGQTVVTKLDGTSRVSTPVTLGTSYGATTEVTKGLAEGDQVVVTFPGRVAGGTASGRSSAGTGGGGLGGAGYGGGGFGGTGGGGFGGTGGGGTGGQAGNGTGGTR